MVQTDSMTMPIIVVCGPTASGKSELAIELAKALDTEIVSADSIAVYKRLDIGTAKPTVSERSAVKHNMIDVVEPTEDFSVAEYEQMALNVIERLHAAKKIPIVCGGTGYFIDSLIYKNSYGNCPKNPEIRARLDALRAEKGPEYLYGLLKDVDHATYLKLSPNDHLRVSRALEIFYSTGVRKSEIIDEKKPRFSFVAFSIGHDRERLYDRIDRRVDKMFSLGLVDEVKELLSDGVSGKCQSMQGIGYKEIVEGLASSKTEEEMKEIVKRNTRRYAKRQITYFKRTKNLRLLSYDDAFCTAEKILKDERFID